MKKAIYTVLAFLLLVSSCKKNEDKSNGSGGSSVSLIPEATGWQRVCSIPYQNAVSGFRGENSMTPYDLTMVGNDLALLYSDNYKMTGVDGHTIMKLMLNNGTVDAKAKAVKLNYDRGGGALQIHRFIPGSFNTISTSFLNNECLLYDEAGGPNAGQHFGSINALPAIRWYADGGILVGMKDGPHSSASWAYQYPATGSFKYVINQWNGDSTTNVLSSPMKLRDGNVYDLVFSKTNGTMYFSVMKNLHEPQAGTAPNYELICRNAVPDLDAAKSYSIVTSDVQGDMQTILLAEVSYGGGDPVYTRLVAFRWEKGTTTLKTLYSIPNLDPEVGKNIMTLTTNSAFPNEVRLTPEGAAYFLMTYAPTQAGSTVYTALAVINKNGVKEYGKIKATELETLKRMQYGLHCCRYFNGAYYAVVHPMGEYEYDIYTPEFRMEVIKVVP